jgi:pyruvate dehydrogenase E2 component (dihydrolipoamide acetyltransferase)
MPVDVLMPDGGSLLKWHRAQGEAVKAGDLLCEVETDKTVMEVEAGTDGIVGQILVEAGASGIAAGQALARIDPVGSDTIPPTDSGHPNAVVVQVESGLAPFGIDGRGRLAASPRARRLASEAGLVLATIPGSGPGGRIVERDVLRARGSRMQAAPSSEVTVDAKDAEKSAADIEEAGDWPADVAAATTAVATYEIVELDGMRRTIAERLSTSKRSVPHFYLSVEIDLVALTALRERINNEALPAHDGAPRFKLSVNDFVVKALALALINVPQANAIWDDGRIRRFKSADVGVAVAVDGGLYTPVLRQVESKSLSALSREIRSLAVRARERALRSHECQGGATTVSNLGMFGIDRFLAIINPPQSSILAVGAARQQVVARGGQAVVTNLMSATLSCDHRVIDGALGARLLGEVKRLLEVPFNLIS